jgi:hypothetical protein
MGADVSGGPTAKDLALIFYGRLHLKLAGPRLPFIVDTWTSVFQDMIDDKTILPVDLHEKHEIEFTGTGWVMQHPLLDRLNGRLFDCDYNQVADEQYREGPPEQVIEAGPSRWNCELSDDGEFLRLLERLS